MPSSQHQMYVIITITNLYSTRLWNTHSLLLVGISDSSSDWSDIPMQKKILCFPQTDWTLVIIIYIVVQGPIPNLVQW